MTTSVPTDEFFIVATPGLEDITAAELQSWHPDLEFKVEHGGITVHAPRELGLSFNLTLKTATRVLLRVTRFTCRDFPKLFKKVSSWPWEEWVNGAPDIQIEASTRGSRLKIKKRIEATVNEAWQAFRQRAKTPKEKGAALTLYVRLVDDECTLSLDTSGERLHKRGERVHVGAAPLRESLASALIQMTANLNPEVKKVEVVDPLMGSGTFLLEALNLNEVQSQRDFSFEKIKSPPIKASLSRAPRWHCVRGYGIEADQKTLRAAEVNLKDRLENLTLLHSDLFKTEPLPSKQADERWLFCNPPYGERLKIKGSLLEFYQNLFQISERVTSPDRACFLLPTKIVKGKFILPTGWKVKLKRPFLNGGIPVTAFVFQKV